MMSKETKIYRENLRCLLLFMNTFPFNADLRQTILIIIYGIPSAGAE